MGGSFIYIRYFAARDEQGGLTESSSYIVPKKQITCKKRLVAEQKEPNT